MKIIHLADTHIKTLKDHELYKQIFDDLFKKIREINPDIIIHCGDIVHSKTVITPELINLTSYFLKGLADIAKTYIILGNHDANLKNLDRVDSISPILELINDKNITLLKGYNTEKIFIKDRLFSFHSFCRLSGSADDLKIDNTAVNIGLYHGSISGCKTDAGFVLQQSEANIDAFVAMDYLLLGDIHLRQSMRKDNTAWYCGSTIQQNHGEVESKGFLVWNIKDKKDFAVEYVEVPNPQPYKTVQVDNNGLLIQYADFKQAKPKLRILVPQSYVGDKKKLIEQYANDCTSVELKIIKGETYEDSEKARENYLLDQNEYIEKYLKEHDEDFKKEVLKEVEDIKKKLNIKQNLHSSRWKVLFVRWDNMFNFGEGNKVDFFKYNGTLGVFGKNFSGKSSLIESLLYGIYGITSKNIKKNIHLINDKKTSALVEVCLVADGKEYSITRTIEITNRKKEEAKSTVEFQYIGDEKFSLNGIDKNETEKNIIAIFGEPEYFLMSSIITQFNSMQFIDSGSTKRKEMLSNFLDLRTLEQVQTHAKEVLKEKKTLVKHYESKGLSGKIAKTAEDILLLKESNQEETWKEQILKHQSWLETFNLHNSQKEAKGEYIEYLNKHGIKDVESFCLDLEEKISVKSTELKESRERCSKIEKYFNKYEEYMKEVDLIEIKKKKKECDTTLLQISSFEKMIKELADKNNILKRSFDVIDKIPCTKDLYSVCPLTKNALNSQIEYEENNAKIVRHLESLKSYEDKYSPEEYESASSDNELAIEMEKMYLEKKNEQNKCLKEINSLTEKISLMQSQYDYLKINIHLEPTEEDIKIAKEYCQQSKIYTVEQIKKLTDNIEGAKTAKIVLQKEYDKYKEELVDEEALKKVYTLYETISKIFHSNGIIFDIIKDFIPYLNEKIEVLLTGVVPFSVILEEQSDKLEIMIQHPGQQMRLIESCSGSEKMFASMAIRIALTKLGNIPLCNLFILDEPATSLDSEHIIQFGKILDMIKSEFDNVVLITHLDILKDYADKQLTVSSKDGFAILED